MKTKIGNYMIPFALGMLAMSLLLRGCNKEEVEVPVIIEVPVPVFSGGMIEPLKPVPIPPIKMENPKPRIDSTYYNRYIALKDSIARDSAYKAAITIRNYKETFEDDRMKIFLEAETTGWLNSYQLSYESKPFDITVDTTLTVKIPQRKRSLSLYGEMGVPLNSTLDENILFKGGLDYIDKKNTIWGLSGDSEKRIWVKLGKRFNF